MCINNGCYRHHTVCAPVKLPCAPHCLPLQGASAAVYDNQGRQPLHLVAEREPGPATMALAQALVERAGATLTARTQLYVREADLGACEAQAQARRKVRSECATLKRRAGQAGSICWWGAGCGQWARWAG